MYIILGSTGYLASSFTRHFVAKGIKPVCLSRNDLNYFDAALLRDFLKSRKSAFLINGAGFTGKPNVDACELAKAECLKGNAVLPGIIREVCEDLRISWGHISSGCIYSGRRSDGKGWTEEDEPNFSFRSPLVVFTVEQKHWVRKFWKGRRTVLFGGYVFHLIMNRVQGTTCKNF